MDWRPENDVELAEMFSGVDGGQTYAKALVSDGVSRMVERLVQPFLESRQTLDALLVQLDEIGSQPAQERQHGFGLAYSQMLAQIFKEQFAGEPETLARLLAALEA